MTLRTAYYPLPSVERPISGSDSGSPHVCEYPTPSATQYGTSGNGTGNNTVSRGRPSLETMAGRNQWPTPTAGDAKASGSRNTENSRANPGLSLTDAVRGDGGTGRNWPTPSKADAEGGPGTSGRDGGMNLRTAVAWDKPPDGGTSTPQTKTRSLSPMWVEWLMGFPVGFTGFADLEMPRFQEWLSKHSDCLMES
jgi:hypothetical protein